MKQNLTPTVITDKNGKTTTVYRKHGKATKTNPALPAPAASTQHDPASTRRIVEAIHLAEGTPHEELHAILSTYPSDLIDKMTPVSPDNQVWCTAAHLIATHAPVATINETLYFYPHMARETEDFAQMHLKSLHYYPQLPPMEDYSTADDLTRQQCISLLNAVEQLDAAAYEFASEAFESGDNANYGIIPITVHENGPFIDSPELIELIMEHPEQVQQIIDTIIERKTMDMEFIRSMVTGPASAIGQGLL